jgi:hypothetical protein
VTKEKIKGGIHPPESPPDATVKLFEVPTKSGVSTSEREEGIPHKKIAIRKETQMIRVMPGKMENEDLDPS